MIKKERKKKHISVNKHVIISVILIADHHHTNVHGAVRACVN